jgi:hypothetical protein
VNELVLVGAGAFLFCLLIVCSAKIGSFFRI